MGTSGAGTENNEVIVHGLHDSITESDLDKNVRRLAGVRPQRCSVARDRNTQESRGFGFVEFANVDDARTFMQVAYPTIEFRLYAKEYAEAPMTVVATGVQAAGPMHNGAPGTESLPPGVAEPVGYQDIVLQQDYSQPQREQYWSVSVQYSRQTGTEGPDIWACVNCGESNFRRRTNCHRCGYGREFQRAKKGRGGTSGDQDVSLFPTALVLVRGLDEPDSSVVLHALLSRLHVPFRRVFYAREANQEEAHISYCIVEFKDVNNASRALMNASNPKTNPKGFIVGGTKASVGYANASIFGPVENERRDNDADSSTSQIEDATLGKARLNIFLSRNADAFGQHIAYWNANVLLEEYAGDECGVTRESDEQEASAFMAAQRKRKRREMPTAKPATAQIARWQSRQEELHAQDGIAPDPIQSRQEAVDNEDRAVTTSPVPRILRSYVSEKLVACLLCQRKFKSLDHCSRHEALSRLHQTNLKDKAMLTQALVKIEKHDPSLLTGDKEEQEEERYRDRAMARRAAFGQPLRPPWEAKTQTSPAQPPVDSTPLPSTGSQMMAAMGWQKGDGLGQHGTGMTAPILAESYRSGVGLGHKDGRTHEDIESRVRSRGTYAEFVDRTKENARRRFHQG